MAKRKDTPSKKQNQLQNNLNTKLAQLDDELIKLVSIQYFQFTAIQAITAHCWPIDSNKLTYGLSLTIDWINGQGNIVVDRLDEVKALSSYNEHPS